MSRTPEAPAVATCRVCGHGLFEHGDEGKGACATCSCRGFFRPGAKACDNPACPNCTPATPGQPGGPTPAHGDVRMFLPEDGPAGTCDWGECDEPAAVLRFARGHGWLPCCASCELAQDNPTPVTRQPDGPGEAAAKCGLCGDTGIRRRSTKGPCPKGCPTPAAPLLAAQRGPAMYCGACVSSKTATFTPCEACPFKAAVAQRGPACAFCKSSPCLLACSWAFEDRVAAAQRGPACAPVSDEQAHEALRLVGRELDRSSLGLSAINGERLALLRDYIEQREAVAQRGPEPVARPMTREIRGVVCTECSLRWEPTGGTGGQQLPTCPLCHERATHAAEVARLKDERDEYREKLLATTRANGSAEAEVARYRSALEAVERMARGRRNEGPNLARDIERAAREGLAPPTKETK